MFDEFVEMFEEVLEGTGWSLYDAHMAPDSLLECPKGCVIEMDALRCQHGLVNPVRQSGLV